jgi:hypothetical protein
MKPIPTTLALILAGSMQSSLIAQNVVYTDDFDTEHDQRRD